MAKDVKPVSDNKKGEASAAEVKKPLIKNKSVVTLILVIAVALSVAVFAINFVRGKVLDDGSDVNEAEMLWTKLADNITYMVGSADISVEYINSDKRTVLLMIGSEGFFSVQYDGDRIYVFEGNYSKNATTNEIKISEAESGSNGKSSIFATNISNFSVQNYDAGKKQFNDGTVQLRFRVDLESNGKKQFKDDTLTAAIPTKG